MFGSGLFGSGLFGSGLFGSGLFGSGAKRKAEAQLAEWLAHPQEFGERPKAVTHKRTYHATLMNEGNVDIHLLAYVMPNGTAGRGFVKGTETWSFVGDEVNAIADDALIQAYCGWSGLFPALQAGRILTTFEAEGEEARFLAQKQAEGLTDLAIITRYKIGLLPPRPVRDQGDAMTHGWADRGSSPDL